MWKIERKGIELKVLRGFYSIDKIFLPKDLPPAILFNKPTTPSVVKGKVSSIGTLIFPWTMWSTNSS